MPNKDPHFGPNLRLCWFGPACFFYHGEALKIELHLRRINIISHRSVCFTEYGMEFMKTTSGIYVCANIYPVQLWFK